jgi:hypothetical protein
MTLADARDLLDAVRDGRARASEALITAALRETGDIEPDFVIRIHRPVGTWESTLAATLPRTFARIAREAA